MTSAGLPVLNIPLEFERVSNFSSGIDPVGTLLGEQAGAAQPGELAKVLAAGQKIQEPKVADIPGDLQKPRRDGLKIGVQRTAWTHSGSRAG